MQFRTQIENGSTKCLLHVTKLRSAAYTDANCVPVYIENEKNRVNRSRFCENPTMQVIRRKAAKIIRVRSKFSYYDDTAQPAGRENAVGINYRYYDLLEVSVIRN